MNQNIICITKVSELEWYLSMKSYHELKETPTVNKPTERVMTLQKFREFYESLAFPMIYESEGKIGFLCPFNDTITIPAKGSVEIPLGYSVKGEFDWIQIENSDLLISHKQIGGTSGACGAVVVFTNLADTEKTIVLKKNAPLGMISYKHKKVRIIENKPESFYELYKTLDEVFPSTEESQASQEVRLAPKLPKEYEGYVIGIHIPTLTHILQELSQGI